MNVVFMGTPDFSVPCLEKLNEYHNVTGVFTQPDKPVGRKQILTPSDVKRFALEHSLDVYQPATLRDGGALKIIKELNPDVIVVVAYGKILPAEILDFPKYKCINVHASLLPKYRGASPIQQAVINGDRETGVTVMQMDEGIDTGDILLAEKTEIDINETSEMLFERLSHIGADALIKTLDMLENGTAERKKQQQQGVSYTQKITKSLSPIDWNMPAASVHNLVRGLQSWPCAQTQIDSKTVKIHKTVLSDMKGGAAGEVEESSASLIVSCGDGKCVEIKELQPDGKKRMDAKSYLAGHKIPLGTILK